MPKEPKLKGKARRRSGPYPLGELPASLAVEIGKHIGANDNFMSTTVHDIKAFPPIFNAVASGDKTFEVRRDTNHFEAGEVLRMREWEYKGGGEGEYSGRELMMEITYVQRGKFNNPVADGFCIMAIRKAEA